MKLIIVRHGETTHNANGVLMGGTSDAPLSDTGRQQSERTADRLRTIRIDAIYSSDLGRAVATARIIAASQPQAIFRSTSLLRERNLGTYQGRHRDQWFAAERKYGHQENWQPKDGESRSQVQARVQEWLKEAHRDHAHDTVLVVSHGLLITILLEEVVGKHQDGADAYRHKNCAVSIIDLDDLGQPHISCLMDESHL